MKIAICCITYNRCKSLKRLLHSLEAACYNVTVPLYISIDKSDTNDVEKYADLYQWKFGPKIVIKHKENLGLRRHILSCGDLLDDVDALIVLEDDITVSPAFFVYAQQCVERYFDDDSIAGISLYGWSMNSHNFTPFTPIRTDSDVYLMQLAQSWGEVWMKKQWKDFISWYHTPESKFNESKHLPRSICYWSEKSWLKYHIKYCIEKNKYFVYPYVSLSTNHSEIGEHNKQNNTLFEVPLLRDVKYAFNLNPAVKYDAYFENENLYEVLGIERNDLCIDLNGNKGNREKKRYWLSMRKTGYKPVQSYGLESKPIEVNIIDNVEGNSIFLYDTTGKKCSFVLFGNVNYLPYLFNYSDMYSHIKNIIKYIINYKQY